MTNKKTKLRPKVLCNCTKCRGKLVDTRTRKKHESREIQSQESILNLQQGEDDPIPTRTISALKNRSVEIREDNIRDDIRDDAVIIDVNEDGQCDEELIDSFPVDGRSKRRRNDQFHKIKDVTMPHDSDDESDYHSSNSSSDEGDHNDLNEDFHHQGTDDYNELNFEDFDDNLFTHQQI